MSDNPLSPEPRLVFTVAPSRSWRGAATTCPSRLMFRPPQSTPDRCPGSPCPPPRPVMAGPGLPRGPGGRSETSIKTKLSPSLLASLLLYLLHHLLSFFFLFSFVLFPVLGFLLSHSLQDRCLVRLLTKSSTLWFFDRAIHSLTKQQNKSTTRQPSNFPESLSTCTCATHLSRPLACSTSSRVSLLRTRSP
jgi:hypothetical protein